MSQLILVVDDEDATRHMLRLFLNLEGFAVIEAGDGMEALEQVALHSPAALILDVMMPIMDGITVCKTLRAQPATANLPILMLSGKTQESAIEEGLQAGANVYLKKPMDPRNLITHLRQLLSVSVGAA
jgi:DNA-binding response OmpR family regulator